MFTLTYEALSGLMKDRAALRAELARVSKERDVARSQAEAWRGALDSAYARIKRMDLALHKIADVAKTLQP